MATTAGSAKIIHLAEIEWEERVNVDGWPCRAGMYHHDPDLLLTLRLIEYPQGSTEPRHVHAGTHATTVLKGRAIIDGITMEPLDMVLGPGGEPHGPLHYPAGCNLLSAFNGDYFHGEVEQLSDRKLYRVIQSSQLPWQPRPDGGEEKTIAEGVADRLRLQALRLPAGATLRAGAPGETQAYLVVEGGAAVGQEAMGRWDLIYLPAGAAATIAFPVEATLLGLTVR